MEAKALAHEASRAAAGVAEYSSSVASLDDPRVVSVIILFFVFEKVSKPLGLCELFFGVPSLGAGTPFKDGDPLIYAVPVSLLFTVVVSLFSRKVESRHLAACFPQ